MFSREVRSIIDRVKKKTRRLPWFRFSRKIGPKLPEFDSKSKIRSIAVRCRQHYDIYFRAGAVTCFAVLQAWKERSRGELVLHVLGVLQVLPVHSRKQRANGWHVVQDGPRLQDRTLLWKSGKNALLLPKSIAEI